MIVKYIIQMKVHTPGFLDITNLLGPKVTQQLSISFFNTPTSITY